MAESRRALSTAWAACAGVIAGAPAVAVTQQLLADVLYFDCAAGGAVLGVVVVLATGALTILGGLISWRARAAAKGEPDGEARQFLGEVCAGAAGVFLLAIVAQGLASLIVPACHR